MPMPSMSKQQQKILNKEYQNWLAVIHAWSVMCDGIRPYIERQMRSFHQTLLVNLARFPPCTCTRLPVHETKGANRCHWAMKLKNWHRGGKPKWQQSDSTKWTDPNEGFCEVAKLFMSDLGVRAPRVEINNSDTTGLINLLYWCDHFTIPQHLVHAVRQARNTWGHSSSLQLSDVERDNSFQAIEDLLQDPALALDPDAQNALAEIKNLPNDLTTQGIERRLLLAAIQNTEDVIKECREQMKKERNKWLKKRPSKRLEKQLNSLERRLQKESEKRAAIEKQLQRIEKTEDGKTRKKSFKAEIVSVSVLLLGLLISGMKSCKRNLQWLIFVFAFLGLFVLLDPTTYEDGCPTEDSSILHPDLRQFNFTSYLNTAREGFVGRKWLFDRIETIFDERSKELSAIIIIGDPGSGKSAIAAQLICSRSSSLLIHKNIIGYHVCKHLDKITQDGGKFVKNLVNMIASRIPSFMEIISSSFVIQRVLREDCSRDPHGCFEQAIVAPLRQLEVQALEREWYFIVVDAIDECVASNSGGVSIASSITQLIRHKMVRLPGWLKLIITSRNDSKILKHFPKSFKVDLLPWHPNNIGDIDLFITTALYGHSSLFQNLKKFFKIDEREISITASDLLRQSQGNFLFVRELLHLWLTDTSTAVLGSIPPTIGDIYYSYFERACGSRENFRSARKILEVLVATIVPLSSEKIFKILYLQDPELDYTYSDFMDTLNGLSHFLRYGEANTVSLFHLSLLEWLTDQNNIASPYFVDKRKGHLALATYYLKNLNSSFNLSQSQMPVLYLAQHIAFGGHFRSFYEVFQKLPSSLITTPIDDSQRTLLHLAAAIKNVDVLRLLFPFFSKPADLKDNHGVTPAFVAAAQGALQNLKFLLEIGADITHITNSPPKPPYEFHQDPIVASKSAFWSSTLLHAASQNGHSDVVEFLLQKNVSLCKRNGVNFTALQLAAQNGHLEIVNLLHKNGAQTDQVALYHAAANGHDDVVKFLLKNASVQDECMRCDGSFYWLGGKTRYQAALIEPKYKQSGDLKKFRSAIWDLGQPKHLKRNVPDLRFVDDEHLWRCQTALHVSVLKGHTQVVKTLLSQSNNALQCTDFSGRTPLHDAVRSNNKAIAEVLLREGANVFRTCRFRQNLTSPCPRSYRKYENLNVMEEYQYDTDGCPDGSSPLHLAAMYGHRHVAAVLKNYGAPYYATDFHGATSLHIAACHGQTDFIQWMISSLPKTDINIRSENRSTPLHSAAICGRFAEISVLIELGADAKSQDKEGMTPLHYTTLIGSSKSSFRSSSAVTRDESKFQSPFISLGRRLTIKISKSEDNIQFDYTINEHIGSEKRNESFGHGCKTARRLLEHLDATTINHPDNLGNTALHLAARTGLECIVVLLLANEAIPQKRNNAGLTALEEAMQSSDPLGTFDVFSEELDLDEKMYDTLITRTECEEPVSNPSLTDLTDHLLENLDGQTAAVYILLSWELEVQAKNKCLNRVLLRAIEERQPHLVLLTILMGADVNQEDSFGRTPILAYLQHGGNYTGFILRQFGVTCPVICGAPFQFSPFHLLSYRTQVWSVLEPSLWVPRTVLYKVALKCHDVEGYTPFHRAAQGGNVEAIKTFLLSGVDVNTLSRDRLSPTFLVIRDAGLRPDLSSVLVDTTRASEAAILIFREVLSKTNFKIRCDGASTKLTIYHVAAYRGLYKFLLKLLGDLKPPGFDIDCPDKFGVTPLYLAKLLAGDEKNNPLNPWGKIVLLIESRGGTMRYPQKASEFRLLYTHLYDTSKESVGININLAEELLQLLEGTNDLDQCFQLFDTYVQRNDSNYILITSIMSTIFDYENSSRGELLQKIEVASPGDSKIMLKIILDHDTVVSRAVRMFRQSTDDERGKDEKEALAATEDFKININNIFDFKSSMLTKWRQRMKKRQQLSLSSLRSHYELAETLLSQLHDFLSKTEKWMSPLASIKAIKRHFPSLHKKLTCEKIAHYKAYFFRDLKLHLEFGPESGWVWKKKLFEEVTFTRSRLPLVLKDITSLPRVYSQFKKQDLVQLIKIVLRKISKFDYLDVLAFGNDHSLWNAIYKVEFDWYVRSMERKKNMKEVSDDRVKTLVNTMKDDVVTTWEREKAKEKKKKGRK